MIVTTKSSTYAIVRFEVVKLSAEQTAQILFRLEKLQEQTNSREAELAELKAWKESKQQEEKHRIEHFAQDINNYLTERRATISEVLAVLELLKHKHAEAYIVGSMTK